jgi:hypothetical protein
MLDSWRCARSLPLGGLTRRQLGCLDVAQVVNQQREAIAGERRQGMKLDIDVERRSVGPHVAAARAPDAAVARFRQHRGKGRGVRRRPEQLDPARADHAIAADLV